MVNKQKDNPWKTATVILSMVAAILFLSQIVSMVYPINLPNQEKTSITTYDFNQITKDYGLGRTYLLCCTNDDCVTVLDESALKQFGVDYENKCVAVRRIEK